MARQLHIGGTVVTDDWELFNINAADGVHHVGDAKDLSRFEDGIFANIYASHILEHFDYKDMQTALKEWHRVLKSEGELLISVPDLDKIFKLFLDKDRYKPQDRVKFLQMIYGGHTDEHDCHQVGFDKDILVAMLLQAGFESVRQVEDFKLFKDCSTIKIDGTPISLNLLAKKNKTEEIRPVVVEDVKDKICKDVMYMMSMPRLAFTDNMYSLVNATKNLGIFGQRFNGVFWEQGMENMLEDAIDKGFKYMIAIDYDTFYSEWHIIDLYNLMEKHTDIGIMAPLQPRRGNEYPMSGIFKDPEGHLVAVSRGDFVDGIMPIDTAHFGLTIIRLSELSKISKPWFQSKTNEFNNWRRGHKDADVNFWLKAKASGIKSALAEVWIGHMQLMCSVCGPASENFKTHHIEINNVLESGLPQWTTPKSLLVSKEKK
jgi:predicted SAM-dependent methyltransferase